MCKRSVAVLLLAALLLASGALSPGAARADAQKILLLYAAAPDDATAVCIRRTEYLLACMNRDAVYAPADTLTQAMLDGATDVMLCLNAGDALAQDAAQLLLASGKNLFVLGQGGLAQLAPDGALERLTGSVTVRCVYEDDTTADILVAQSGLTLLRQGKNLGGEICVGAETRGLCLQSGRVTHLAWYDGSNEMNAMLAILLTRWLWPYEVAPASYSQYVVIDQVYPFEDPARVVEWADLLAEEDVPGCISVMPLYDNSSYPAMKRFCEALRYAQSKGVGIILRSPLVRIAAVEPEELTERINLAFAAYAQYGVYPLALEMPDYYLLCAEGVQVCKGFRAVFLFATDGEGKGADLERNIAYADGHYVAAPAYSASGLLTTSYVQAIYLDSAQDTETLRAQLETLRRSKRALGRLRDLDLAVYAGTHWLTLESGVLRYDGTVDSLAYAPFVYDENYVYDRGIGQYMRNQILTSNHFILLFVLAAAATFILLIAQARRRRRELLRGPREKKPRRKDPPASPQDRREGA